MELEDLKNTWKESKIQVQQQPIKKPELVPGQKYRSNMKRITFPEMVGSIICLAAAAFIGFNFENLDTVILKGAGVVAILLLLLLPILSALSIGQLNTAHHVNKPYAETLKTFARQKIRFVRLQKLNVTLSYLLLVSIIVIISRLMGGKDLSVNKDFWIYSFTIGFIFLLFYSRWVENYYRKTLQQAEELLRELAA